MFPFPDFSEPERTFTDTEYRVEAELSKGVNLGVYGSQDLYSDMQELGFEPPLTRNQTDAFLTSFMDIIEATYALQSLIPGYKTYRSRVMGINLARHALNIGDIITANYAAGYADHAFFGRPNEAAPIIRDVNATWRSWIQEITTGR